MTENKWPESFYLRQNRYLEKVSNNEQVWKEAWKKQSTAIENNKSNKSAHL